MLREQLLVPSGLLEAMLANEKGEESLFQVLLVTRGVSHRLSTHNPIIGFNGHCLSTPPDLYPVSDCFF